jgi:hypothetical protein
MLSKVGGFKIGDKSLTHDSGYECDPDPSPGQDIWLYYCKTTGISVTSTNIPEYYTSKSFAQTVASGSYNLGARIAANSVQVRFQSSDLPLLYGFSTNSYPSSSTDSGTSHSSDSTSESKGASNGPATTGTSTSSIISTRTSTGASSNNNNSSGISSPSKGSPSLSTGVKIGIGSAVGLVALSAAIFAFFFLLRRAKKNAQPNELNFYAYHANSTKHELGSMEGRQPLVYTEPLQQPQQSYSQQSSIQQSFGQLPAPVQNMWTKRVPDHEPLPPSELDGGFPYASELSSTATLRSMDNKSVHGYSMIDHGYTKR